MEEKLDLGLELRMYFLTMYNISDIQKGIQCGHAALEYASEFRDTNLFNTFVKTYKTWIILNGGTSTKTDHFAQGKIKEGSMETNEKFLRDLGINYSKFYEPDLNYSLSSLCFILDERVFNMKKYPQFDQYYLNNLVERNYTKQIVYAEDGYDIKNCDKSIQDCYAEWLQIVGGETNAKLKLFISKFKLA